MRRLLHAALALAACVRAAPLDADADRLPGWLGERDRDQDAQAATPDRWIEPIAWEPRCDVSAAACVKSCHLALRAPPAARSCTTAS